METRNKETTFNSSMATLIRIDKLISELHCLRRGIIPLNNFGIPIKTGNPTELYLDTLFDLHIEVGSKMTKGENSEFSKSEEHQKKIEDKKYYYGRNLYVKTMEKGMPPRLIANEHYYTGWNEMQELGDVYFMFLMNTADKHGMLLTTKATGEDATGN